MELFEGAVFFSSGARNGLRHPNHRNHGGTRVCRCKYPAYGAVLYLVTPKSPLLPNDRVRLLKAKGKITPVHKVPREDTMPRWELASILVASNITTFTLDAVPQLRDKELFIWNDSKAALSWCTQVEIKDTYVHNRVTNIRERCPTATIKYVATAENPADIITRDITAKELHQCRLW